MNPALLPCLFVPDKGPVRVVLECEEGSPDDDEAPKNAFKIYDGFTRSIRTTQCKGIRGTAYVIRSVNTSHVQRDNSTWIAELSVRFRKLVVHVLIATLMINLLSLAMPLFMMSVYDTVIPSASVQQLVYLVSGVGLAIGD